MSVPAVLLEPAFDPLWRHVARALDRNGLDDRRRVRLPDHLDRTVHRELLSALGRRRQVVLRELDLAELEDRLRHLGTDLPSVLAAAGHTPSGRKEARDAGRSRRAERDAVLDELARDRLGEEPWTATWATSMRRLLPDAQQAREAVEVVARVLDEADRADGRRSRGEIAARTVPGGAHGLDRGARARAWVRAALAHRAGGDPTRDDPNMWDAAGLPGDVVSAPVLTWALPLCGDGVAAAVRGMTAAGAPAPLTTLTIRELDVVVPSGTVVLSVENPRLLEAAAQQRLPAAVVCTNGEPTRGVTMLLQALTDAGAHVRHHGDFDAAGLRIAARLHARSVTPWCMDAADYRAAVAQAEGVELPRVDPDTVSPTPWDPALRDEMRRHGRAVEEERVMDEVLRAHAES
ncbi:DUF2399 domain-containing protein [Actinomycetospora chibensis]|uniref:DUF2399 domain-containing protein n=1 Tax=Actinomycetospora chibensis TaxID=663606 RepID=A0ABV9RA05_9PSEU|nr:DUF2399 domain-containing protein [Actinomycetospora chibensis]MDD7924254.1 DUF2399 domain-containing protein [Actinomycetospora chibensis]